ncbi:MAG TPA: proliferating cell nuclear antigen (pcna) [Allocoleopsis sp.]
MTSKKDCVLDIKSVQSNNIKILFEVLKEVLVTDINLIFTPTHIKAIEKDGKEKAMVHLYLESSAFEHYYCEKEKITVGINTTNFFKIIKNATPNDVISFYIERNKEDFIVIRKENSEESKISESKLKILDIHCDYTEKLHPVEFESEISMPSTKFQKYMKELKSLGLDPILEIKSIGQQIIFSCIGDFSDNKIALGNSENVKFEKNSKTIIQGMFSLNFLILFTKATNLCQTVHLYMKNDSPLFLKYTVGNLGCLKFILKPEKI